MSGDRAREQQELEQFEAACREAGFDLAARLQVGWYNARVEGTLKLEDFGSEENLALVIGNTRALWPKFIAALRQAPELLEALHPLQAYTERSIARAAAQLSMAYRLRWSHAGGPELVAMQRLAHTAGLAYLTESHLSVHPTYGPWIALRAALSFDLPGPAGPAPELAHPCGGCHAPCREAFERARSALVGAPPDRASVEQNWRLWLACRSACPLGHEHRYTEEQIHYHYVKDRQLLRLAAHREA